MANDTDSLELESLILEVTSTDPIDYSVVPDWKIHLAENLVIPINGLPSPFVAKLQGLARFANPVFFEKQRQRFPTYNIPRRIFAGELYPDRLVLPRGCLENIVDAFAEAGSRVEVEDHKAKREFPLNFRVS